MKIKIPLLAAIIVLFIVSCERETGYRQTVIDGFAQGSTYHIVIRDSVKNDIAGDIERILEKIDNSLSVYNPNSLLSRINRNETDSVDRMIADCIRIAEELSIESGGLFDITVKPLTTAYGFAGGTAQNRPNIDSLLQYVGYEKIRVENGRLVKENPNIEIDLNAIAQGYTVDEIARYFDSLGLENYLVEVGGEIFSRGLNSNDDQWVVGIEKPIDGNFIPGEDITVKIHLSDRGLATSGNYRKFFTDQDGRKIVHTIDPIKGEPVISNLLSATVVARDATYADIYGTYFMVAGLEETLIFLDGHPDVDAFLVYSDEKGEYRTYATSGLWIKE